MIRRVNVNGNGVAVLSRSIGIGIGGGGATSATNQRLLQAALYGTTAHSNAKSNPHWLSSRVLADRFGPFAPSSVPKGVVGTRFIHSLAEEPPRADKFSPKDVVLFQYEACPFCNKVKGSRLN
jgi:microsomal prostaglandin-E synthase 2